MAYKSPAKELLKKFLAFAKSDLTDATIEEQEGGRGFIVSNSNGNYLISIKKQRVAGEKSEDNGEDNAQST